MPKRTWLITGGAGFIGTNMADRLLRDGQEVVVLDDLSRDGVQHNLGWLEETHPERLTVPYQIVQLRFECLKSIIKAHRKWALQQENKPAAIPPTA